MIVLKNSNCEKCPYKELTIITINPIIESCIKCKEGEYNE